MLMMIVALPSLGLNLAGSRIEEDEVDPLGLAYTTIGNLGFSDGEHPDVGRARSARLAAALTLCALSAPVPTRAWQHHSRHRRWDSLPAHRG